MNWTEILAKHGIPEPPGRAEAVPDALRISADKRRRKVDTKKPPKQ